jgi:hypothetical protein
MNRLLDPKATIFDHPPIGLVGSLCEMVDVCLAVLTVVRTYSPITDLKIELPIFIRGGEHSS